MTKREELEADLVRAQAVLADAVLNMANSDANQADANAYVERARARCREIRAALDRLDRPESMVSPVKQSGKAAKGVAAASPPSTQPREHAARHQDKATRNEARRRKPVQRSVVGASARKRRPRYTPARAPLVRQTIGLLALILAYLFYFHMGVQLQILRLPTLIPLSEKSAFTRMHHRPQGSERTHR